MSRASRDKGKRGEREVAAIAREEGFPGALRTAELQAKNAPGAAEEYADVFIADNVDCEVKRRETWDLPGWLRELHAKRPPGRLRFLAFRKSNRGQDPAGEWHATLPLRDLLRLIREVER